MDRNGIPITNDLRHDCRKILIVFTIIASVVGIIILLSVVRGTALVKVDIEEEKIIYDQCIEFIQETLSSMNTIQNYTYYLNRIESKVLVTLQNLTATYKRNLILYLYEKQLIRADVSMEKRLSLNGANLNNVRFQNLSLTHLYLPSIVAFNSVFSDCQLNNLNFQRSMLDQSHFINCSLELAIFSGSSLRRSSFINISDLSSVDFTNTDLLNSTININKFENTSHLTHARLPNGSFHNIDSNNLILDGGAEEQCHSLQSIRWNQNSTNGTLRIAYRENNSCIEMTTISENDCLFQANSTSALSQHIDLNRYSTLIDNNLAWLNLSVYLACSNNSTDRAFAEIYFPEKLNNFENALRHAVSHGGSWALFSYNVSIPVGVRTTTVVIGGYIEEACCVIDDIALNMFLMDA